MLFSGFPPICAILRIYEDHLKSLRLSRKSSSKVGQPTDRQMLKSKIFQIFQPENYHVEHNAFLMPCFPELGRFSCGILLSARFCLIHCYSSFFNKILWALFFLPLNARKFNQKFMKNNGRLHRMCSICRHA